MPIAASIIQRGSVLSVPSPTPWISAYPRYAELLAVWTSIFLGRDTFADLALLPQLWFCGLGIYVAARRLGAQRPWAVLCASLGWFAPIMLIQAKSTFNDIMIGCLWAIGLAFALPPRNASETAHSPSARASAWLTGLAAGLIIGTKATGPVLAVALAALYLGCMALTRTDTRSALRNLATFCLVAFVAGSIWGWINLAAFGNPIYPVPVRLVDRELLPGRADLVNAIYANEERMVATVAPGALRLAYAWLERQDGVSIDARLAGLGPLWAVVGLPAAALWVALGWSRRTALAVLVIGVPAALLTILPDIWIARYSVFVLAAGGCALAGVGSVLNAGGRRWAAGLTVALASFSLFISVDHRYFDVARIRRFAGLSERERTAVRWDPRSFGSAYRWVDRDIAAGSTIAYGDGVLLPYPLWGSQFERTVIYVPASDVQSYFDDLTAAGAQYAFLGSGEAKAAALRDDARAHLAFDGDDGFVVFALNATPTPP
jgi:hypothetical protein